MSTTGTPPTPGCIEQHLDGAFGHADPDHFAWQTSNPYVGQAERELVRAAFFPLGTRVLDLGCAEGATLHHLDAPAGSVGVDLFEDKLEFARKNLPSCRFVRASGYELPFEAGAFNHVLVRDVVHHVEEPERFFAECARVLEPAGRIDVLEPYRNNPLIVAHALSTPAERGELRSTPKFVARKLAQHFEIEAITFHQALPIHRVVFHPKLGRPALADRRLARIAVQSVERLAAMLMPRFTWAYFHVRARRA